MSKPYQKECIFCQAKITMSDEKGKWRPYNEDGTEHDCKKKQQNHTNGKGNNDISIEVLLRKLKTVGITLDLEVLRNTVNGNVK